ncbi:MAG: hypothetical protein EKK53_21045 [Burkholderiales bacterium]|nr:MAG: hypothetical protein EKK53_21045 [Burkholderiales bacterium]
MATPLTFQQLLNNMLPPKTVNGILYVPRITYTQASDPHVQDFDASRDGRMHGGADALYAPYDPATGKLGYATSKDPVNQNVLIGAPVDGTLSIITEGKFKIAVITDSNKIQYVVRHMSNLADGLDGQFIQAGTVIGTMSNVGT